VEGEGRKQVSVAILVQLKESSNEIHGLVLKKFLLERPY